MATAKYPVKSLAKALKLLDALGKSDRGSSIATLSKDLKLGKSTIHRLLATLREFDLVWFDPATSNYALGARILRWSELLVQQNLLIRQGLPVLRSLVETCHETASLGVLEGNEVMFVARFESSHRLRMSDQVGARNPAHCTALGKALLAALPEDEFRERYDAAAPLRAVTPNSITSVDKLWDHLQKVRLDGVAYDFEENIIGGVCMAAVVKNHTGTPVAAMSVSLPTQRLRGDILITLKEQILGAASRLSGELGHAADARA